MLYREITHPLELWKVSEGRKVLLLRGARQVGKTFSVRQLAKTFSSYIEVNFLEAPELKQIFQGNLSPQPIVSKLEAYYGVSLASTNSLLFLDEIQECPEAITALRFFYEKLPELHVIAAGSLLEFSLKEISSFGVGRVDSLFMYPLTFNEFVRATDGEILADQVEQSTVKNPLDPLLHEKACERLRTFSIIGGLPAVVSAYCERLDINRCLALLDAHILGYFDDFAKYRTRISHEKLRATFHSSARQAGGKFVYSRINPGSSISGFDQALELLCQAGLVHRVYRSAAEGNPLGSQVNQKKFKILPLDLGVYNRLLDLRPSEIILKSGVDFINSGATAEVLCGLELIAYSPPHTKPQLYYWDHEQPSGNAEVDYVIQLGTEIVPLEVKAGTKGKMQSMYEFLRKKGGARGIRASLEPFATLQAPSGDARIDIVPLYAVGKYATDWARK